MSRPRPQSVMEQVPLAPRTTLGVGGPARFFAACASPLEVARCLAWAADEGLDVFVLGGGSNLVVADQGFDGLVVVPTFQHWETARDGGRVRVVADAGVVWDHLVADTVRRGLAGLECLSGIPGTVGASPVQNVGAYGQEVGDCLEAVEVLDRQTGRHERISASACGLGYRTSHFKTRWRDRYVILRVILHLTPGGAPRVGYPELAQRLQEAGVAPGLDAVRKIVLSIRASKSMRVDPLDPNSRSAGSFFTNPVVSQATAQRVRAAVERRGLRPPPLFPASRGKVKIPAAFLIEAAGFPRGFRQGKAAISSRHALALVNTGGATADEVVALAARIRRGVMDAFGVALVPEPRFLGFDERRLAQLGVSPGAA